ncbi:riboflavin kinase [Sticta canariensis]|nr:riboflavin kinase [Sticta canariensis]
MRSPCSRSPTAGPPTGPAPPFPIRLSGSIIKGFGRGSKELGIPTANIPITGLSVGGHDDLQSGVYFGWAGVSIDEHGRRIDTDSGATDVGTKTQIGGVWQMVMSIGWNPFYRNTVRSVEVHIIPPQPFIHNFYGAHMNLLVLGFIRPEFDYESVEALVVDIELDIEVSKRSLDREAYKALAKEAWLLDFDFDSDRQLVEGEVQGESGSV